MSLRKRLLLTLIGAISLVWLCVATLAFLYMRNEVDELFNHQLQQVAATVDQLDLHRIDMPQGLILADQDDDDHLAVYLWDPAGKMLLVSPDAPRIDFQSGDRYLRDIEGPHGKWRVWQYFSAEQQRWIAVARELTEREELLGGLLLGLFLPWLFSLMLVIWLVWLSIDTIIGKLAVLSGQISNRKLDDLTPIDEAQAPVEVQPLVHELNLLLARLDSAMQGERRFTADAAHELRTPLAAIRIQAELAGQETGLIKREAALRHVIASVDRAAHTVNQLLVLARLDNRASLPERSVFDLQVLAQEVLADMALCAVQKQIEPELLVDSDQVYELSGQREWLRIVLRNVLENALSHAANRVSVSLSRQPNALCLTVADDGPGVSAESLPLLGERFFRADVNRPGTGLGLSIVRQIVRLHGGSLQFANRDGLVVTVVLPLV